MAPKSVRSSGPMWGPRELPDAGTHMRNIHALERSDYLQASPAPQEKSFALTPVKLSDILSESFRPKEALFPEKCIISAQNPCAPLGL